MSTYRLRVETGTEKGRIDTLPPEGASIGRSRTNVLCYADETLSRRHCSIRIQEGALYLSDLATVNGTRVNGKLIENEVRILPGDTITIGGTTLLLSGENGAFAAAPAPVIVSFPDEPAAEAPAPSASTEPATETSGKSDAPQGFDLGFSGSNTEESAASGADGANKKAKKKRSPIALAGWCVVALMLLALVAQITLSKRAPEPSTLSKPLPPPLPPAFSYLKLEGSGSNIFRYEMELAEDGTFSVSIHDLAQDRHVRKESMLSDEKKRELAAKFKNASFFTFAPLYRELPRQNSWKQLRLSARLDGRSHTVESVNAFPPQEFLALLEALDTFGQNELGLWAFAMGRDQLLEMAEKEIEKAHRLYDERNVKNENLFYAIASYSTCLAYLDSFDPKPDMYDEAIESRQRAVADLEEIVKDRNWKADLYTNTKDWLNAKLALLDLLQYIPDRTDKRHDAAKKRLLDVENRLRQTK